MALHLYDDLDDPGFEARLAQGERWTATFEDWRDAMNDSDRAERLFAFLESKQTITGTVRGEVVPRTPWLGHTATVEVNLVDAFDEYLRDHCWPGRN